MMLKVEILESKHEKKDFDCGAPMLNNYIRTQAKQDVKRDLSACFVLVNESNVVHGYYTLSASSIRISDFPDEMRRKLPASYESLPAILLGRFAVDKKMQGKGIGRDLIGNALKRCLKISKSIGSIAIVVDPIDEKAQKFYSVYGFVALSDTGRMMLSMKTAMHLVETLGQEFPK